MECVMFTTKAIVKLLGNQITKSFLPDFTFMIYEFSSLLLRFFNPPFLLSYILSIKSLTPE